MLPSVDRVKKAKEVSPEARRSGSHVNDINTISCIFSSISYFYIFRNKKKGNTNQSKKNTKRNALHGVLASVLI